MQHLNATFMQCLAISSSLRLSGFQLADLLAAMYGQEANAYVTCRMTRPQLLCAVHCAWSNIVSNILIPPLETWQCKQNDIWGGLAVYGHLDVPIPTSHLRTLATVTVQEHQRVGSPPLRLLPKATAAQACPHTINKWKYKCLAKSIYFTNKVKLTLQNTYNSSANSSEIHIINIFLWKRS